MQLNNKFSVFKPIFIIGSGRSGTTLLYRILSGHPDLAWISTLVNKFPQFLQLSFFNRFKFLKSLKILQPNIESNNFYKYCGITNDFIAKKGESLIETDVTNFSLESLQKKVLTLTKFMDKKRFISKNTSNSMRVRYLNKIFPDALFIHIIRNGYGGINSLLNVEFWPDLNLWWLGKTPKQWKKEGGNPYELGALHWKRQVAEILTHKNYIPPQQYMECRYEELLTNTNAVLDNILIFCQLEWNDQFRHHIEITNIRTNSIDKWRKQFDTSAKKAINKAAGDLIEKLGYAIEN